MKIRVSPSGRRPEGIAKGVSRGSGLRNRIRHLIGFLIVLFLVLLCSGMAKTEARLLKR